MVCKATWWLVMTRPFGETNEPEPPVSKRTEPSRTWSSHSLVGSNWYFSLRYCNGRPSKGHMPSSGGVVGRATRTAMAQSQRETGNNCMKGSLA